MKWDTRDGGKGEIYIVDAEEGNKLLTLFYRRIKHLNHDERYSCFTFIIIRRWYLIF